MKYKWVYYLFLLSSTASISQNKLDSLYSVWEDSSQTDSRRIESYNNYIRNGYLFSKPDSAMVLATRLYEFSNDRQNNKGLAISLHTMGIINYIQGKYDKAMEHYKKSLLIREELKDLHEISKLLNNIAGIYHIKGSTTEAINFYERSLEIKKELSDKKGISTTLSNIGNILREQGDNVNALEYYINSLEICKELEIKDNQGYIFNNIGLVYSDLGDQTNALKYFIEANEIAHEIENSWLESTIIGNIGLSYDRLGKSGMAMKYYLEALELSIKNNDQRGITLMQNSIGGIYKMLGNYNEALNYLLQAKRNCEEMEDNYHCALIMNNLGEVYLKKGSYLKAIQFCNFVQVEANKINSLEQKYMSCECLYKAYKAINDGNNALKYHEQMLLLNDSLQKKETVKELQKMEFNKKVLADSLIQVEKDLKVEMAHKTEVNRKNKNKNIAIGIGIFFLILSGGFFSRWRYVRKSKSIIEKEKNRSENLLLNILPSEIAEELKEKGSADARDFDMVSILFTDFKGFTQTSEKLSAKALIEEINHCFKAFDYICEKYGIEKIKTIGDSYMAAGGLPVPSNNSVKNTVLAALKMQSFISKRIEEKNNKNEISFKMRLGIHTGPVVAGIVGVKKFQYDIWGDTVNTASRMESSGEIGRVNISQDTYNLLKGDPQFKFESRGKIQTKGKGELEMYFVEKIVIH